MLKIKNTKNNIITKIIDATYKKIKKGYEEVLSAFQIFFDSYDGRYIIKYILSIRDGFFTEEDLKKFFPKYYLVIEYLVKKNHIFGVKYNEMYDIYTSKDIPSDEYIVKSYNKYLTLEQYKKLICTLKDNISSTNMEVSEDIIINRINKEYEKYQHFYAKGYVSVEYKICFLYNKEFSQGFQNINEFEKRYYQIYNEHLKAQNIMYVYFFKNEDMFCLKPKYQEKYFGFVSTYAKEYANKEEIYLVHMICESYRNTFKLEDIVNSLKLVVCERKIKAILKHSLFYYQIKNHTYIKSDCLKITDEMKKYFFFVSKMTKKVMFEKINERYNEFIKYYKIKNAKYLFQMVKKITYN